MTTVPAARQLREELANTSMLAVAGAVLPITGLMCKHLGFKAVYMSGSATEATYFGNPDLGLKTLTESVELAGRVASVSGLPLICDGEAGFGDVRTVRRAVREFERAGVAGIHIEDQETPPNGPGLLARRILPRQKAVDQIKAALDSRSDPDFVIIARTDADEISVDEVIERCNLFAEAGADLVMPILFKVDGVSRKSLGKDKGLEVLSRVRDSVNAPLAAVGFTELVNMKEAEDFGIKMCFYHSDAHQAAMSAMFAVLRELAENGSTAGYFQNHPNLDPAVMRDILNTDDWMTFAANYGSIAPPRD